MSRVVRNLELGAACGLVLLLSLGKSAAESPAARPVAVAERPAAAQATMPALDRTICDDTICVSLTKVSDSIHQQLDGKVVGYAFFVGNALSGAKALFGAYGEARTKANPPAAPFKVTTKMQIASTSKVLTALTALRVLSSNINKPAASYFPPSWVLPPSSIVKLLYMYPGTQPGGDWHDLTLSCGDWGWYVSVQDYAAVLVSLNAGDGKILSNCELSGMVTDPANHPVGWDIKADNQGHRWLEKNGADGTGAGDLQTASVGIYGGRDGCVVKGKGTAPVPGVPAALFINSTINGVSYGADTVLIKALQEATTPKP